MCVCAEGVLQVRSAKGWAAWAQFWVRRLRPWQLFSWPFPAAGIHHWAEQLGLFKPLRSKPLEDLSKRSVGIAPWGLHIFWCAVRPMADQLLENWFGYLSSSCKEKLNWFVCPTNCECKMRFISFLDFLIKSKILLQLLIYWIVKRVAYVFNDP